MAADLHRPICDLLDCEYPIVLAGMGGVARAELVVAVTEAGGFGFLGMVREPVDLIRAEVARVRARTDRDFGVNLIPAATDPALLDAQIAECIALQVPVVCLFWDLSTDIARRLLDAGIIVVCQVGSVSEAVEAERAGAHALIAQGREAGGHVRGLTPREVLLREVSAITEIPVLAAGGIVSGADLAAILAQGGGGAVIGTAFLATPESFAHDYHKQRITAARSGDTILTDIFHINWPIGAQVRVLKNSVTEGDRGDPFAEGRTVIGEEEGRPIYLFSTDSPLRTMTGDFEAMALYAGEAAGQIESVLTAGERLRAIVHEAEAVLKADAPVEIETPAAESSSPACWAGEAGNAYMGFAEPDEIAVILSTLIATKRASARVLLRSALEARTPALRGSLLSRYHNEADWRHRLTEVAHLPNVKSTSGPIHELYGQAMNIVDASARQSFLDVTQGRLLDPYRSVLPRVRDDVLHATLIQLLEMFDADR